MENTALLRLYREIEGALAATVVLPIRTIWFECRSW